MTQDMISSSCSALKTIPPWHPEELFQGKWGSPVCHRCTIRHLAPRISPIQVCHLWVSLEFLGLDSLTPMSMPSSVISSPLSLVAKMPRSILAVSTGQVSSYPTLGAYHHWFPQ